MLHGVGATKRLLNFFSSGLGLLHRNHPSLTSFNCHAVLNSDQLIMGIRIQSENAILAHFGR